MNEKSSELTCLPLWLIDIDGVLNAYAYPRRKTDTWKWGWVENKMVPTDSGTFNLWVSDGLVEFLNKAHASGLVDMRWCTTWADEANSVFAPTFGFPTLPVAAYPDNTAILWKHLPAYEAIKNGRRLIWTDDDAIDARAHLNLLEGIRKHPDLEFKRDLLVIEPDGTLGLTPDDCEAISTFLGL